MKTLPRAPSPFGLLLVRESDSGEGVLEMEKDVAAESGGGVGGGKAVVGAPPLY
jgi:hypothetical protein